MADSPSYPASGAHAGVSTGPGQTAGMPRWVRMFGIAALVLVLILVGMIVIGGGNHGPGRHTGSGDARDRTPPAGGAEGRRPAGHTPPERGHR